jgi:hypothetical protein
MKHTSALTKFRQGSLSWGPNQVSKLSTTKAAAKLQSVFASAALNIIKPIAICALLKFKEVRAIYSIKINLTQPKLSVRALLIGVKTVNISILI